MQTKLSNYIYRAGILVAAGLAVAGLQAAETTDSSTSGKGSSKAAKFLQEAAQGNNLEVAAAEVGVRKAQNEQLRSFAQQMQKDHTSANQQLASLAQAHGVSVQQSMEDKHQKHLEKLQKASGSEFDKELATFFLKEHQKDIEKYAEASRNLDQADVKNFAATMLPKLRQHFQHALQVARAVGVSESTITSIAKRTQEAVGGSEDIESGTSGSGSDKPDYQGK